MTVQPPTCRYCQDLLPSCACVRQLRAAESFLNRPTWAKGMLHRVWLASRRRAFRRTRGRT